jgi:hypothetical protein
VPSFNDTFKFGISADCLASDDALDVLSLFFFSVSKSVSSGIGGMFFGKFGGCFESSGKNVAELCALLF